MLLSKPTTVFDVAEYSERLWLPIVGEIKTTWRVCAYISPFKRIVKVVDGFINAAEQEFPYAVATLKLYTVDADDTTSVTRPVLHVWESKGQSLGR